MSEKIYRWLLSLYPRRFRSEYGDAMQQLFLDRLTVETGIPGRLRLWTDVLKDLAVSVPREYRRRPRSAPVEAGVYRISEEAATGMLIRTLAQPFLSIAAGFPIAWFGDAPRWPLYAVYGVLTFFAIYGFRHIARHKDHWRSFELILEEDRIQQVSHGAVPLTLVKADVAKLLDMGKHGIAIQTNDHRRSLWVPPQLNGYEELRSRLAAWAPIEQAPKGHPWVHGHHAVGSILAIYPAALLVRSPYFAIPLAAVLLAGLMLFAKSLLGSRTLPDRPAAKVSAVVWIVLATLIALLKLKLVFILR